METGRSYGVTLEAGARCLVDFIKETRGCYPRFYVLGRHGGATGISVAKQQLHPHGAPSRIRRQTARGVIDGEA